VRAVDGGVSLRVIVDRSTVEVFANDGETVVPTGCGRRDRSRAWSR
jgi:sucrose-6-phosphate hydrolase SacC (GH32 family)